MLQMQPIVDAAGHRVHPGAVGAGGHRDPGGHHTVAKGLVALPLSGGGALVQEHPLADAAAAQPQPVVAEQDQADRRRLLDIGTRDAAGHPVHRPVLVRLSAAQPGLDGEAVDRIGQYPRESEHGVDVVPHEDILIQQVHRLPDQTVPEIVDDVLEGVLVDLRLQALAHLGCRGNVPGEHLRDDLAELALEPPLGLGDDDVVQVDDVADPAVVVLECGDGDHQGGELRERQHAAGGAAQGGVDPSDRLGNRDRPSRFHALAGRSEIARGRRRAQHRDGGGVR